MVLLKTQLFRSTHRAAQWRFQGFSSISNIFSFSENKTAHKTATDLLRHYDDLTQLQKYMSFWFKNSGHKLYKNPLQCEMITEVAWLEYSARKMDKDLLARKIFSDFGVEVCLFRKTIYLGKEGPIEEKVRVKAVHV